MRKIFSLLVPSRNRPDYLTNLCKSIKNTVDNPNSIEVLVAIDRDCTTPIYKQEDFPWLTIFVKDRSPNISSYFNWLFNLTTGEFLWILNDDTEIQTNEWDKILVNRLPTNRPLYCLTTPTRQEEVVFSEFPIISKSAVKKLGYVMPEAYPGHAADNCAGRIYTYAGLVIDCTDITVNHVHASDDTHNNILELSRVGFIDETKETRKLL